ncbi:MAG: hypothetical protein IJ026_04145 [Candidatus Methanomethylophilaceae archaeon]|nr:hypothetical protein [Candidatus Methanomethylophilaceae archaeon]
MSLAKHDVAPDTCDVAGCDRVCERSCNIKLVARSSLKLREEGLRQVHLCREHYREFKKETKSDRQIDQMY